MVLKKTIFLFIFFLFAFFSYTQTPKEKFELSPEQFIDSEKFTGEHWRDYFLNNKANISKKFELACVVALSHYPELKDVKIKFVEKKIKATMAARPAGLSIFRKGPKRKYKIFINNKYNPKGMLLEMFSFDSQTGVVGHELGHIAWYINRSTFGIIADGTGYLFPKFRANYEKATDRRTVDHGLGWQLYSFTYQGLHELKMPEKYLQRKKEIYLSPEEILEYINNQSN
ncbi:MAG: hypothetical protein COA57_07795 [Flavobacteriales bacterium]|nr:MAG: hypothetical protein COA57_07795 [Flavobacteriales bacterium]